MTEQVKALATKPNDLSSISRAQVWREGTNLTSCPLILTLHILCSTCFSPKKIKSFHKGGWTQCVKVLVMQAW